MPLGLGVCRSRPRPSITTSTTCRLSSPAAGVALFAQLAERLFEQLVALGHGAPHHEELERSLRRTARHPLSRRWLVLHRTGRLPADLACPGLRQLDMKCERRA